MITPRLSVAFVGVAIATALVPPLSSSAICLARGEYALAWGTFLIGSHQHRWNSSSWFVVM